MLDRNSKIYKKYVQPSIDRDSKRKKNIRKSWLADHAFDICNSVIAFIALVVAVIALFRP